LLLVAGGVVARAADQKQCLTIAMFPPLDQLAAHGAKLRARPRMLAVQARIDQQRQLVSRGRELKAFFDRIY
jgi:hypothetical protein